MRENVNYTLYGRCYAVARRFMLAAFLCCFFYGSSWGRDSIPVVSTDANGDGTVDSPVKPLSVGDEVPDIPFEMINYHKSTAKLSDFRGKLVILDFWGTFCHSCIAAFPEEQSLKERFGNKIEILLVNSYDKKGKVDDFLKSFEQKKGIKLSLPIAVKDSIAKGLFPHASIPHCVWVSSDGELIAITSAAEVDSEHIAEALEGKKLDWLVKDDYKIGDYTKPYLLDGQSKTNGILVVDKAATEFYNLDKENESIPISVFTKSLKMGIYIDGNFSNDKDGIVGVRMINLPLTSFFQRAYNVKIPPSKWVFECDKTLFDGNGRNLPLYCFEFLEKEGASDNAVRNVIKLDLYKAFGLIGTVEKRSFYCNEVIYVAKKNRKAIEKSDGVEEIALGELVDRLNYGAGNYILSNDDRSTILEIESKDLAGLYDLKFDDIDLMFEQNGCLLKKRKCEIECFVIKEKKIPKD